MIVSLNTHDPSLEGSSHAWPLSNISAAHSGYAYVGSKPVGAAAAGARVDHRLDWHAFLAANGPTDQRADAATPRDFSGREIERRAARALRYHRPDDISRQ